MKNHAFAVLATISWLTISAVGALAQEPVVGRPYRGVFAGGERGRNVDGLNLRATLVEAYDDDLLAESGGVSPTAMPVSGLFTMLQAGSNVSWSRRRLRLGATGASAWRYYNSTQQVRSQSHGASAGMAAMFSERTTLFVNQTVAYSPSYLFGLFPEAAGEPVPGSGPATAPDYRVNDLASFSYVTTATLRQSLQRRLAVTADVNYSFTDFAEGANGRADMTSYGSRVGLSRNVGRHTELGTGYRYQSGDYALVRNGATEHGVDLSVAHTKVLSATRRAQFGLTAGLSRMELPIEGLQRTVRGRSYRLVSNAYINYDFNRSWRAHAAYQRSLEYIAELSQPVFVSAATSGVDGLLTQRLGLNVTAGYSRGASLVASGAPFDTYTADIRSEFAASRTLAVYLEYLFYVYDFGGSRLLAPGLSPYLKRNGVRGGLTVWVPTFRKGTHAAR